ncbi:MAG: hypothetical protein KAG91_01125 [Mycoplasmataceae bacterium]|nr:hypothetical protein [Mycoplasmataceae bacterium]
MKKILLGLGTIAATTIPVVAVVSCSMFEKKEVPKPQENLNPASLPLPILKTHSNNIEYDKLRISLQDFSSGHGHVTKYHFSENPFISGYLRDVNSTPRKFVVFDNGLFKIKIEESLIGTNRLIASNNKALLIAREIAKQINIGPAINDLPKGIQILNSTSPQSLGGQRGVQVSLNANAKRAFSDRDIKAVASLVAHEYGHHETMWDNQKLVTGQNGAFNGTKGTNIIKLFKDLGYKNIAALIGKSVANKAPHNYGFVVSAKTSYATAYGMPNTKNGPQVFSDPNYPFSLSEITTRTWNILSYTMSQKEAYEYYDIPAFLTSDQTMRHHAHNSIFGTGKTNTNIQALYDGMLKYVNGLGTKTISLKYNLYRSEINGIEYNSFGKTALVDSIKLFKNGTLLKEFTLEQSKGLFGHKSELFSEVQTTKNVYDISSSKKISNLGINTSHGGKFTLKGFKGNKEVDISGMHIGNAIAPNGGVYPAPYLQVEGNHLLIT